MAAVVALITKARLSREGAAYETFDLKGRREGKGMRGRGAGEEEGGGDGISELANKESLVLSGNWRLA